MRRTLLFLTLVRSALIFGLALVCVAPGLAHDDPHESIERITLQIEQDPYNAELYLRRGELHRQSSHFDAALADFDYVAALSPDDGTIHFHRGRLLLEAGEFPEAWLALDRFLNSPPTERSLSCESRQTKWIPNPTPVMFVEHAQALAEAGGPWVEMAIQSLDDWNQKLGPLILLQSLAIDLEVEGQRYDAALVRIDQVLTEMARKEKWLVRRGEVLEMAGSKEEARVAYRDALKTIEALPSRLRQVPASRELETHVRALLDPDGF